MKKISKFAAILTALALALALTACSHPNSGDDSSGSSSNSGGTQATYLDGTYTYSFSLGNKDATWTFRPDGTFGRTGLSMTDAHYTIEGNTLSGSYTYNTETVTVSGTKTSATTWSITIGSGEPFTITKQ